MKRLPAGALSTTVRKIFACLAAFFIISIQSADAQIPAITSFTPTTGGTGTVITVTGTNFTNVLSIDIGGMIAPFYTVINSNTIQVKVGAGASGNLRVWTLFGTASRGGFVYVNPPPPTISSFSPEKGNVGTVVTINGANFSPIPDSNVVYFGGARGVVSAASTTALSVIVPPGATYQPLSVKTNDLTGYAAKPFNVTFEGGGAILPASFENTLNVFTGGYVASCKVGDLDGDGKNDIISSTVSTDKISIFRNTSTGGNISFATKVDSPAIDAPWGIAIGDLDGDGRLDAVAPNQATITGGRVSVFHNTSTPGKISFKKQTSFTTGANEYSQPTYACIKDLNGDGRADLMVANGSSGTISVFKSVSIRDTIMFQGRTDYFTGVGPQEIVAEDLNNDGRPEIIVSSDGSAIVSVFTNTSTGGNISFAPRADFSTGTGAAGVAVGDLDGDGKPDVAVASIGEGYITVYRNTTTGSTVTFDTRIDYSIGIRARSVAIADLDGDGKPDMVGGQYYSPAQVVVMRNNSTPGALAFDPKVNYAIGDVWEIAVGDLDGNGTPDIAAAGATAGAIGIYKNKLPAPVVTSFSPTFGGAGTVVKISGRNFVNATSVTIGGTAVSSFTVDTSTTITAVIAAGATGDVVVTTPNGSFALAGFRYTTVPLITNFLPKSGPPGTQVIITGANFSNVPANNTVYFGPVKATVTNATANQLTVTVPTGADLSPITVTVNNLTAYSKPGFDVTFPGAPASYLSTSFASKQDLATPGAPYFIAAADLDGDGKTDLVVPTYYPGLFSVYRNNSSTGIVAFHPKLDITAPTNLIRAYAADFDGDGKQDIVTVNWGGTVSVFRNTSTTGNISFAARVDIAAGSNLLAVGDINSDGKPDLVVALAGSFRVFRNTSTGATISFVMQSFSFSGVNIKATGVADLNNDGKPEVFFNASSDSKVIVYGNTTTGGAISFAAPLEFSTSGGTAEGMSVSDVDGDGKPDITVVNYNTSSIAVLRNTSGAAISFQNTEFISSSNPVMVSSADLDGDGKPDACVSHNYFGSGSTIALLKNTTTSAVSFAAALTYSSGDGANGIYAGDLNGDGKPEIAVANLNGNTVSIFRNKINEPLINGSGASPVTGDVISSLTYDATVQTFNGIPYVQRHYDIEPVNNPSTATATITLYFSQQDFDNFNAHPAHGSDLPTGPTDVANKANVRIYQYHGFSTTSLPGSYSGSGVVIDPDDNSIVWNAVAQWWEVTFDVNGFSGFFAGSAAANLLPVKLLSFTAKAKDKQAIVEWTTAREINVRHFEVERKIDNGEFKVIATLAANGGSFTNHYQYNDALPGGNIVYYRLKTVDNDGKFELSKIVMIKPGAANSVVVLYPNPVKGMAVIGHPAAGNATIQLADMNGRIVKKVNVQPNVMQTKLYVNGVAKGMYTVIWRNDGETFSTQMVIE